MTGEIRALTSLRGVAALFVMLCHFRNQFGEGINLDSTSHLWGKSYLWVDFFFLLSGFVIALAYGKTLADLSFPKYRDFLGRRLARIYPLHLVMLVAFVPTEFAKLFVNVPADPAFSVNSLGAFVLNLTLMQAWGWAGPSWNPPSWSISAEWAAYLVAPIIFDVFCRRAWITALLGVAGIAAAFPFLVFDLAGGTLDITFDYGLMRCVLSFALGMVAFRVARHLAESAISQTIWPSAAWLASAAALLLGMHLGWSDLLAIPLFWALIVATALNRGRVADVLEWRPLYFLGTISYSIYLTHWLILRGWLFAFLKVFGGTLSTPSAAACMIALAAFTVLVSALTYRYVENPGRRVSVARIRSALARLIMPASAQAAPPSRPRTTA